MLARAVTIGRGGAFDPRGPAAAAIADLWWLMLALGVAVFVLFAALLAFGLLRQPRERALSSRSVGRWIVGGGVIMPTVVVAAVFVATVVALRAVPGDVPPDALVVDVVGRQFAYEISYPGEGVGTVDELHLPVGRPVALRLTSEDVIHSFWVPELGGKLDMLPDGTNTLVLQADEPGTFRSRCAEFCGLEHAHMELRVVAEPPERFAAWVAEQR